MAEYKYSLVDAQSTGGIIVSLNGMKARSILGFFYYFRALFIVLSARKLEGCLHLNVFMDLFWREAIVVSYWRDKEALYRFVSTPQHKKAAEYAKKHPDRFNTFQEYWSVPGRASFEGHIPFGGLGLGVSILRSKS